MTERSDSVKKTMSSNIQGQEEMKETREGATDPLIQLVVASANHLYDLLLAVEDQASQLLVGNLEIITDVQNQQMKNFLRMITKVIQAATRLPLLHLKKEGMIRPQTKRLTQRKDERVVQDLRKKLCLLHALPGHHLEERWHQELVHGAQVGLEEAEEKWNVLPVFRSSRNAKEPALLEVFLVVTDIMREVKIDLGEDGAEEEVEKISFH